MASDTVDTALRGLTDAIAAAHTTFASCSTDEERAGLLRGCVGAARLLTVFEVESVAALQRGGFYTERGYRSLPHALSDQFGWEYGEARQHATAVDTVCPRVGLDGTALPPLLPATAVVFTAGQATVRHVERIAKVLRSDPASRLTPDQWAGVEAELADKATQLTPTALYEHGMALVHLLDQDGPEPDDREPDSVNELQIRRRRDGTGGTISGRFEDPTLFAAISQLIDAKAKPLGSDDRRGIERRQAEALADICGYVLDHGDVPERGGQRPQLNVLIGLKDLEGRARGGTLDFGGSLSPSQLRRLACDCNLIPAVLNAHGEVLDIGRTSRIIPDAIRRALNIRDRGCAWIGCDRPPSWCDAHHVIEWRHGGETKIDNCVLLCKVHHRLIHASDWMVRIRNGLPEFIPPRWIDPDQTPRRRPQRS